MIEEISVSEMAETVRSVLEFIDGEAVESTMALIMGTAAAESDFRYLRQMGYDPILSPLQEESTADVGGAFGYTQVEIGTAMDMLTNWHRMNKFEGQYYSAFRYFLGEDLFINTEEFILPSKVAIGWALQHRPLFSVAVCRLVYKRKPGAIPQDWQGRAEYWKEHYNTVYGAGTPDKFLAACENHDLFVLYE